MAQREDIQDLLGRTWCDRYQILEYLGRGGMGAVFKARQIHMDREVALKVIHRKLCQDDKQVQRFEQEARTSSKLNHPNSIRVFDYGKSEDGRLFMAMEFLRGRTLGRLIADEGPLEPTRVIHIARQMFKSLAEAHQLGLVHRDLKPENIFICEIFGETDYVKVLDFGIAKAIGPTADEANLTQTGFICGTPRYLSPEQALGQKVDGRADLYSVGVLMYEMLTGRPPFVGENPISIVMKHVHDDPPPLTGLEQYGDVGLTMGWLVERLLEKNPARRPSPAEKIVKFLGGGMTQAELLGRSGGPATKPRQATSQLAVVTPASTEGQGSGVARGGVGAAHPARDHGLVEPHAALETQVAAPRAPEMRAYEFKDMGQGPPEPTLPARGAVVEEYHPPPLPVEASHSGLPAVSAGLPGGFVNPGAETAMIPSAAIHAGLPAHVPLSDDTALIARPVGLVAGGDEPAAGDTRPGETMMLEHGKQTRQMSLEDIGQEMARLRGKPEAAPGPPRIRRPKTHPPAAALPAASRRAPAGLVTDVTPAPSGPRPAAASSPLWAWVLAGVAVAVMLLGAFTLWWSAQGGPAPRAVARADSPGESGVDQVRSDLVASDQGVRSGDGEVAAGKTAAGTGSNARAAKREQSAPPEHTRPAADGGPQGPAALAADAAAAKAAAAADTAARAAEAAHAAAEAATVAEAAAVQAAAAEAAAVDAAPGDVATGDGGAGDEPAGLAGLAGDEVAGHAAEVSPEDVGAAEIATEILAEPPTQAGSEIGRVLAQLQLPAEAPPQARVKAVKRATAKPQPPHATRHRIGEPAAKPAPKPQAKAKPKPKPNPVPKPQPAKKKMNVDFEVF